MHSREFREKANFVDFTARTNDGEDTLVGILAYFGIFSNILAKKSY